MPTRTTLAHNTLCMGLDIAWFGGSAANRQSRYDCLGAIYLPSTTTTDPSLSLERIPLPNRDPDGLRLWECINSVVQRFPHADRVVFAIDAPLQAETRPHLPPRAPVSRKGAIERRACEVRLSAGRKAIDSAVGGPQGWHPNVQPGAPVAPRVQRVVSILQSDGFSLWEPGTKSADRLVVECFPAEAIWAAKRQGGYAALTAQQAKQYKKVGKRAVTSHEVERLVRNALASLGPFTGNDLLWQNIVGSATEWMLADQEWSNTDGTYKAGKLLDDVVDTLICLATSVSYAHDNSHVWRDDERPHDGHIIGVGPLPQLLT